MKLHVRKTMWGKHWWHHSTEIGGFDP